MPPSCLSKCHPLCDRVALRWPGYKCSTLQSKVTRFIAHTQSRHVKKDARYSSDSVGGTSGLGRGQTSEQDEASFERQRREPLRGSGGMPHQKIWKSRGSEVIFQAFSVAFFFRKVNLGPSYGPDRVREQVKVQVQGSGKMKTWGGSQNQGVNILNSQIVFCQNSSCPFGPLVPTRNAFAAVSWPKESASGKSTPSPEEDLQ